ncbi:deoxyribodipyrimidine photolyase [Rhodothalassium salexigens]|uniref:cryptochrome/photolyase family protein n=1 Tax=Rhodothalassium salexigens TaxID=1086 RepID=UPI0019126A38|nr:deoxyribodipyrimidine photo-lyase [Rhodothalassium salexigens]MBK5912248.1 deoxyribodipyrimidine photolyase [Rhodothalassium salexigens]MBK5921431.1 deoxyribodipyrimidine photolyase [Rhodothalassium salexigens]
MAQAPVILWFRDDLRVGDQPALLAAVATGAPVLPVFVADDAAAGDWAPGGAARWWLHHSLTALDARLRDLGVRLQVYRGETVAVLARLAGAVGATAVHTTQAVEPWARALYDRVAAADGLTLHTHAPDLLYPPGRVLTGQGTPYKVFTPFWRALQTLDPPGSVPATPARLAGVATPPADDGLSALGLCPTAPDWAAKMAPHWTPGEAGAEAALDRFLDQRIAAYETGRDHPGVSATSALSPHLARGEISPRTVWARTRSCCPDEVARPFLRELAWRDFAHHLLHFMPDLPDLPMKPEFKAFPWVDDDRALAAWQRGRTGYPIVDAGMRQLWQTGWMHNRVRMIVGSFLVKHLRLHWRLGERWFWDTLVDADLANNAMGWQWIAGCGPDAAPYFRIFNPVTQGEKFDAKGAYVRHYVPELAALPDRVLHQPWAATAAQRAQAGVRLGDTYPHPIVDHKAARQAALAGYEHVKAAQRNAA